MKTVQITSQRLLSRIHGISPFYKHTHPSINPFPTGIIRNFCLQTKETKPDDIETELKKPTTTKDNFELIYTSNYKSTIYGVKFLSFTGCITSLIVAPTVIFNPLNVPFLASISMIGKCFLGIPVAIFGVGTSYALHSFTKSFVTKMYYNKSTQDIQLQFVTIYLSTITLNTNMKNIRTLDKSKHIGMANVECTDIDKKCFIDHECLSEDIAQKIGFNNDDNESTEDDTSWMGKQ